jgi:hypothetical protein
MAGLFQTDQQQPAQASTQPDAQQYPWQSAYGEVKNLFPDQKLPATLSPEQTTEGKHMSPAHPEGRAFDIPFPDTSQYQQYASKIRKAHPDWKVIAETSSSTGGKYYGGPNIHVEVPSQQIVKKSGGLFDTGTSNSISDSQYDYPNVYPYNTRTWDGLPAVQNPNGSHSGEISIGVNDPRLNNGRPTNIPSLWNGKKLSEKDAIEAAVKSGKRFKSYNTWKEANAAAEAREAYFEKLIKNERTNKQPKVLTPAMMEENKRKYRENSLSYRLLENLANPSNNQGALERFGRAGWAAMSNLNPFSQTQEAAKHDFFSTDRLGYDVGVSVNILGWLFSIKEGQLALTKFPTVLDEGKAILQSGGVKALTKYAAGIAAKIAKRVAPPALIGTGVATSLATGEAIGKKVPPKEALQYGLKTAWQTVPIISALSLGHGVGEPIKSVAQEKIPVEPSGFKADTFTTEHPKYVAQYKEAQTQIRHGLQRDVNAKQSEVNQWRDASRKPTAGGSQYDLKQAQDKLKESQQKLKQFDFDQIRKPVITKPMRAPKESFMTSEGKMYRKFPETKKLSVGLPTDESQLPPPPTEFFKTGSNIVSQAWTWFRGDPMTGPLYKALDQYEAGIRFAEDQSTQAHDIVGKDLTALEKRRIFMLLDEPEKYSTDLLTDKEKVAYNRYLSISQPFSQFLVDKGILNDASREEIRAKHLYGGSKFPSFGEFRDFMMKMPGSNARVWQSWTDGKLWFDKRKALYSKLGLTVEAVQKMDKNQLERAGLRPEDARWSRMIPIFDPAKSLSADIKSGLSTLFTRRLMDQLEVMKEPGGNGRQIIYRSDPKNVSYNALKIPGGSYIYVLDKYYKQMKSVLDPDAPPKMLRGALSLMRHLEFVVPIAHDLNLYTEKILMMPKQIVASFLKSDGLEHMSKEDLQSFFIAKGLNLHVTGRMNQKIVDSIYQQFPTNKLGELSGDFYYHTLWKFGDSVALTAARTEYALYRAAGYNEEEAGRMATAWANQVSGNISSRDVSDMLGIAQWGTLTPKWIPSKLREFGQGFIAPWKAWKGFSAKEQAGLAASSAATTAIGWGMVFGFSNLLNYMFTGHASSENPEGHRYPWESNIQIMPHTYISLPIGKQVTLPVRAAIHPTRLIAVNFADQIKTSPFQNPAQAGRETLSSIGGPIGSLYREATGKYKSLSEAPLELSGSYVSHTLPVPNGLLAMLNAYGKTKNIHIEPIPDPVHDSIMRAFKDGGDKDNDKWNAGRTIAIKNNVTGEVFGHLWNKFKYPVHYYWKMIPDHDKITNKPIREKFFRQLSRKDQIDLTNSYNLEGQEMERSQNK